MRGMKVLKRSKSCSILESIRSNDFM